MPRGDGYEQAWAADRQRLKLGIPDRNSTKEEGIGRIVASKVYVGLLRPVEERDRYRLNLMIWIQARLLGVEYLTLRRPPAHTASTCKPQLLPLGAKSKSLHPNLSSDLSYTVTAFLELRSTIHPRHLKSPLSTHTSSRASHDSSRRAGASSRALQSSSFTDGK